MRRAPPPLGAAAQPRPQHVMAAPLQAAAAISTTAGRRMTHASQQALPTTWATMLMRSLAWAPISSVLAQSPLGRPWSHLPKPTPKGESEPLGNSHLAYACCERPGDDLLARCGVRHWRQGCTRKRLQPLRCRRTLGRPARWHHRRVLDFFLPCASKRAGAKSAVRCGHWNHLWSCCSCSLSHFVARGSPWTTSAAPVVCGGGAPRQWH